MALSEHVGGVSDRCHRGDIDGVMMSSGCDIIPAVLDSVLLIFSTSSRFAHVDYETGETYSIRDIKWHGRTPF